MIYTGENDGDKVEESVIAKSTGKQKEKDIVSKDNALYRVLGSKKKITKIEAGYQEQNDAEMDRENVQNKSHESCVKCKFNLPDEKGCHIVEGEINNEYGISNFFSPRGDGMLPGDIVWDFIKKNSKKLEYQEGHVISNGAEGFQCRDCKYYMYSGACLLIKGKFDPEMSCAFVIKNGNGTEI